MAYDGDQPGREATLRAAELVGGLDARAVWLPEGRDPADVLVAVGARLDRWTAHAGNPVALVDAVRDVAAFV